MIVDCHAHYPVHLMPPGTGSAEEPMTSREWRARWRARLLSLVSRVANYQGPGGGPAVTVDLMRRGDVQVALSVLYSPLSEIDLKRPYAAPPEDLYFRDLVDQLELVERDIATHEADTARVVHTRSELRAALDDGRIALIHCVEGGFHLGDSAAAIRANVAELARRGVAYITLAHLFWRQVATNSVALPMPQWLYRRIFRQPRNVGLSERGIAALEAMIEHGILIDVAHMSETAIEQTLAILDEGDPEEQVPVIASHMAYRFGRRGYNLSPETVLRIARRGGVMGLTLSQRHLTDGLPSGHTRSLDDSIEVIATHIDRIRELTGSFDHVAIGSDLDGYIKPSLHGLEHMGRLEALERALRERYGDTDAERICGGNILRLLEERWQVPGP